LLTHRYHVITDPLADECHTLSFYGTRIAFYSRGVWTMDTDSDVSSYQGYLIANNNWDVAQIKTENGIDTTKTVKI
jgi:hypothetical protein